MFQKKYKVTGQDVDDFMVMEETAYYSYSLAIAKSFLRERNKPLLLKNIMTKPKTEHLASYKDLMFTQKFTVNLDSIENSESSLNIKNRFFNGNNELCAQLEITIPKIDNRVLI